VAFLWDGEIAGRYDLYVQLVGGDEPLRLTHLNSDYVNPPAWSPDGREIAFGNCDDNGGAVYIVPALGGGMRKITEVACPYGLVGIPQWTSDAKSMVLQDRCKPGGPMSIIVFSLETGMRRCLTNPPFAQEQGDVGPLLSPDQKTVAFLRWPTVGIDDIFTVPLAGGEPHRLTADNKAIYDMMWSADGKSISFDSDRGGLGRAWRVSFPAGVIEPERVYPSIGALSTDGSKLAYVEPPGRWIASSVIWRADLDREGGLVLRKRRVLSANSQDFAPQMSPDGNELAFESARSGRVEIWKCNADGSDLMKLTSLGGHAGTPRWSPDGEWILFTSTRMGFKDEVLYTHSMQPHGEIFVMRKDGTGVQQLTDNQ